MKKSYSLCKIHARSEIYDKIKSFGNKEINQYVMLLEENE